MRLGLGLTALLAAAAVSLTTGCSTLAYYGQAVSGHLDLVQRARPVPDWLADPATPAPLRERLALSQQMRDFAIAELALPDNRSYRRYADLGREAVVWNVVAAPELSLTLKTWCFPVVGCVGYRGSFKRAPADATAAELRAQGYETHVYGVPAYSTLGKTDWLGGDPLLNTFINWSEPDLAALIFHELAHQVVYVDDDTEFNESYATAVERLGRARWLARRGDVPATQAQEAARERRDGYRDDFRLLTRRTREALQDLYASDLPDADKRQRKALLLDVLRADHAALKAGAWGGYTGYDRWMAGVNNAQLAVQAAYDAQVPAFERLFEREGRDFTRFHRAVRDIAALPKDRRRATLAALAEGRDPSAAGSAPTPALAPSPRSP